MRLPKASVVVLAILVLGQLNWSSTSWAWTLGGHRLIAIDALTVLPLSMRDALTPHVSVILAGVVEPDVRRLVSHKIPIVALRPTPPPFRSGAADELKRLATYAQEMLRLGRGVHEATDAPEMLRLGGPGRDALCLRSSDPLCAGSQPATTCCLARDPRRALTRSRLRCFTALGDHTYRGFMLVRNYSCFAYEIAQNSSQHAGALFFEREIKRITEIAWDQAVNDTANLWQSIFWHALGAERSRQLYGISAPVRETGHGSLC